MSGFYKGAIAVHKPTNRLFRAEHLRDSMLFPGESPTGFKVDDCRLAVLDDIPMNRPFQMRVGDRQIHIRFDEVDSQFVLTDGVNSLGVMVSPVDQEFFDRSVQSFANYFSGAIVHEQPETELLPHWRNRA